MEIQVYYDEKRDQYIVLPGHETLWCKPKKHVKGEISEQELNELINRWPYSHKFRTIGQELYMMLRERLGCQYLEELRMLYKERLLDSNRGTPYGLV